MLKPALLLLLCSGLASAQPLAELRGLFQQACNQAQGQSPERLAVGARCEILGVMNEGLLRGQGDWNQFFQFYQVTQSQAVQVGLPQPMLGTWQQIERLMVEVGRSQGHPIGVTAATASTPTAPSGPLGEAARLAQALENQARRQKGSSSEALTALAKLRQDLSNNGNWAQSRRQFFLTRWGLGLSNQSFEALDRALDQL